jgi:hypothetical protein
MQSNCEQLMNHLRNILSLTQNGAIMENDDENRERSRFIHNEEILDYATQHDIPIFVSTDGSLKNGVATVSLSIIAPHILNTDTDDELQKRPDKVLLIQSWRLPQQWGTGITCTNMAEAIGFIIGEYTIPMDLPIIYITNSNNAPTLQCNTKNKDNFIH